MARDFCHGKCNIDAFDRESNETLSGYEPWSRDLAKDVEPESILAVLGGGRVFTQQATYIHTEWAEPQQGLEGEG